MQSLQWGVPCRMSVMHLMISSEEPRCWQSVQASEIMVWPEPQTDKLLLRLISSPQSRMSVMEHAPYWGWAGCSFLTLQIFLINNNVQSENQTRPDQTSGPVTTSNPTFICIGAGKEWNLSNIIAYNQSFLCILISMKQWRRAGNFWNIFLLEACGSKATQDSENNQTSHHDDLLLIGQVCTWLYLCSYSYH